jgi:hypothetical protein
MTDPSILHIFGYSTTLFKQIIERLRDDYYIVLNDENRLLIFNLLLANVITDYVNDNERDGEAYVSRYISRATSSKRTS